ncbi:transcriptional regulator [Rhizobium sp. L43]|nr:transcriptional regulator [Rhizobium sp. L43]
MSQPVLAARLGITFQQIQKYEKGKNRVSASVLYAIMCALNVPAAYFFDGVGAGGTKPLEADPVAMEDMNAVQAMLASQENMKLLHNYLGAPPAVRKAVRSLPSSVAKDVT